MDASSKNCFDSLRHFAAFLVLFSHHFALSGFPEPSLPSWETFGFAAVVMFFAISGFFMPQSFETAGNFISFIAKRCRRILPGLVVCSIVMVYLIGAIFTQVNPASYLLGKSQIVTVLLFSTFQGRSIHTVFSDFIFKDALNGSLWTLPVEFSWYVVFGIALSYGRGWKTALTLLCLSAFAVVFLANTGANYVFYNVPARFFALFGIAFLMGALLATTRKAWEPYRIALVVAAILSIIMLRGLERQVLGIAGIAVLTIITGTSFRDSLIRGRFDISYGVYIYAFPIQQIIINRVLPGQFWLSMAFAAVVTTVVATASFLCVERKFLRRHAARNNEVPTDELQAALRMAA